MSHLHVLTPPHAGPEPRHGAHAVCGPGHELAGLQPEAPLLGVPGPGLAGVLPHVPVPVLHQVGLGEDVACVEAGQEAVVLVIEAREPEAEALAECLRAAAVSAAGEGGHGGDVPDHGAVVLVARPGLGVAPGENEIL